MQVILKPVSHPQLGEIRIVDELFAIGRNEEPFASRLGDAAAKLSRRHARIFQEEGKVFIADLGSRNGTRINERPLKSGAAMLVTDDVITFGGEISLRVRIEREPVDRTRLAVAPVRLILTPLAAGSSMESLTIERFPFLVARVESAFEQYKERFPEAVRQLSRRHAVIALKGDHVYVEDLASSNGTFVSGKRLDERAQRLAEGDTVMFGSEAFSYRVHIERADEATRLDHRLELPEHAKTVIGSSGTRRQAAPGVSAAVVDRPKPHTAKEAVREPEPLPPRVDERPSPAQPAQPSAAHASAAAAEQPEESSAGSHTRFVSSADSFLRVFCAEGDEAAAGSREEAGATAAVPQLDVQTGWLHKARARAAALLRAVGIPESSQRRAVWGAAGIIGAIAIAIGATYLLGNERREIKTLLDAGRYADSARAANGYLKNDPDDREAGMWASEAVTKAVTPVWIEHIEQGKFAQAASYLGESAQEFGSVPDAQETIDTLSWAGKVEAHVADRGGIEGPIVIFRHEDTIASLVEAWDKDSFRRQQLMDQILTRVPQFEPVHRRVYSNLRALRSENALYVKAITQLKSDIEARLSSRESQATGKSRAIDKLIDDFAASYPRVSGLDALRADVSSYGAMAQLAEKKQLAELVRSSRTVQFRTPVFERHVADWLARSLPPQPIVAQHAAAAAAWQAGDHAEAIATLQPLTEGPWGEVAVQQISRYQNVRAGYEALLAARGGPKYWDQLLSFWGTLRPNEDDHLIRELEPDFAAHRELVLPRLDQSLHRVQKHWGEYQDAGGISGVVRVEARVSDRFKQQAQRLSSAYDEVLAGARTYRLLKMQEPEQWRVLQAEIVDEVQRQRRWLQELNIVLEPALLRAKLELLPEVSEESLWARSTTNQGED